MKKSAKRFLSTILALTMLCSCMVIANVSTVMAAISGGVDATVSANITSENITAYSKNGTTITSTDTYVKYEYDLIGYNSYESHNYYGLTLESISNTATQIGKFTGSSSYISFTTDDKFDISISNSSSYTDANGDTQSTSYRMDQLKLVDDSDEDGTNLISGLSSSSTSWSATGLTKGSYTFTRTDSNAHIHTLTITVYKTLSSNEITISGAPDGYVVASGTSVISPTEEGGNTYLLTEATEYTVWAEYYEPYTFTAPSTASTVTVSMTASYVGGATCEISDEAAADGVSYSYNYSEDTHTLTDTSTSYTNELDFDVVNVANTDIVTISGTVEPSVAGSSWAVITAKLSDGSSVAIRSDSSKIYNLYTDIVEKTAVSVTTGVTMTASEISYELVLDFTAGIAKLSIDGGTAVEAAIPTGVYLTGIQTVTSKTGSRNITISTPAVSYGAYVVFEVSEDEANSYDEYYIVKGDTVVDTNNTVYTAIDYDGDEKADYTPESGYVVAYVIDKVTGTDTASRFELTFE
ncbi:MAG: hypothetical protein LUD81_05455 [Clostridiales bacterium]|nr:hypothetical protein [Clostridiales bacterium]